MSQLCRLISWSMAFHSSGPRELNSSPTAENRLVFTALATCTEIPLRLSPRLSPALRWSDMENTRSAPRGGQRKHWPSWRSALGWTRGPALRWSRSPAWKTRWAWWWGRKESSCNTCHSGGFPRLRCSSPAWRQEAQGISVRLPPYIFDISSDMSKAAVLTVKGWWRWWTEGGREPPGHVAPPPGRTA